MNNIKNSLRDRLEDDSNSACILVKVTSYNPYTNCLSSNLPQQSLVVRATDSRPEGLVSCRNCGGGDRGGVAIYRPFGKFRRAKSYCHLYGAQGQRQGVLLAPCHDEFRGPRSDYVRQLSGYGHELVAGVLLPLKTRRVDEAISPTDVVVRKEGFQLRCPPRHSTEAQNYEVCDQ
ncbi:hypothetical protein TNCV_4452311 [Trichonephila clavipes]|nr:hypothetical protein TNCV_4452311 [Trichonephila clavipes]